MSKCYCETVYDGYCGHCFDEVERERDEAIKERDEARASLRQLGEMILRFCGGTCFISNLFEAGRKAAGMEEQ